MVWGQITQDDEGKESFAPFTSSGWKFEAGAEYYADITLKAAVGQLFAPCYEQFDQIPSPAVGEKPGVLTVETYPDYVLNEALWSMDTSSTWQVSSDGVTFEEMPQDAVFEDGKYYRTSAIFISMPRTASLQRYRSPSNNE